MIFDSRIDEQRNSKDGQVNMVNKLEDSPPAYHNAFAGQHGYNSHAPAFFQSALNASDPPASVDQVHISENKDNIHGTYFIDPTVSMIDRRKSKHNSNHPLPHASFRSRKGDVDLKLATTGNIRSALKADIAVSTRHGNIKIDLLPMPPSRPRIGLDVQSRHGNILIFIPEDFSGVFRLSTRKGQLRLLPGLLTCAKEIKYTDREKIFMVGTQNNDNESSPSRGASFCEISTRKGNIVIGVSGRDAYAPQMGFWKRLGGRLGGSTKEESGH